jgi:antitoxin HicB
MWSFAYPADFMPDEEEGGFVVVLPDVAGAVTYGATQDEAYEMAQDALAIMLESCVRDGRSFPEPSPLKSGQIMVAVTALDASKLALGAELLKAKLTKTELAARLGVDEKEARRILAVGHNTKLDTLEAAFKAIGRRITIQVEAA